MFISSGYIAVMVLEKLNAVDDMKTLCGPCDSDLWDENPDCLRARFGGGNRQKLGVRSSKYSWNVEEERNFFFSAYNLIDGWLLVHCFTLFVTDEASKRNINSNVNASSLVEKSDKVDLQS